MRKRSSRFPKILSAVLAVAAAMMLTAVAAQGAVAGGVVGQSTAEIEQALIVTDVDIAGGRDNQIEISKDGTRFKTNTRIVAGDGFQIHIGLDNRSAQEATALLTISSQEAFEVAAGLYATLGDVTKIAQVDANTWMLTITPSEEKEGQEFDLTIGVATSITMGNGSTELTVTISPILDGAK